MKTFPPIFAQQTPTLPLGSNSNATSSKKPLGIDPPSQGWCSSSVLPLPLCFSHFASTQVCAMSVCLNLLGAMVCWSWLLPAVRVDSTHLFPTPYVQWSRVGSLKLAMEGYFTSRKSANPIDKEHFPLEEPVVKQLLSAIVLDCGQREGWTVPCSSLSSC